MGLQWGYVLMADRVTPMRLADLKKGRQVTGRNGQSVAVEKVLIRETPILKVTLKKKAGTLRTMVLCGSPSVKLQLDQDWTTLEDVAAILQNGHPVAVSAVQMPPLIAGSESDVFHGLKTEPIEVESVTEQGPGAVFHIVLEADEAMCCDGFWVKC